MRDPKPAGKPKTNLRIVKEKIETEIFPIVESWGFIKNPSPRLYFGWDKYCPSYAWDFIHENISIERKLLCIDSNSRSNIVIHITYIKIPSNMIIQPSNKECDFVLEDLGALHFSRVNRSNEYQHEVLNQRWIPFFQKPYFSMKPTKDPILAEKRATILVQQVKDNLWKVKEYFFGKDQEKGPSEDGPTT